VFFEKVWQSGVFVVLVKHRATEEGVSSGKVSSGEVLLQATDLASWAKLSSAAPVCIHI
jgi:hypothetical protein